MTLNISRSEQLFQKAKTLFPGGVNSPVRAFKSVGGTPLFIEKGDGSTVWDADGNSYIDFCGSWGPLILGHNNAKIRENVTKALENGLSFGAPTQKENELGELILNNHPFLEKIRFVSSGTEAVMSAIRLARGYTNRNKIVKFEGCYHGHSDYLLVKAGSGLVTFGESDSAGVPESFAKETIVLPLNNIEALNEIFHLHGEDIACIIIEPIPANNGLLLQEKSFLNRLRELCTQHGSMLIFDEVISGFRIGFTGAAGHYQIKPDIMTYGKIIGGGLPVGAYGASAKIMATISPEGPVYQAGTLSGNPIAMTAGFAQLSQLLEEGFYQKLEEKTLFFVKILQNHIQHKNYPVRIFSIGSIFWISLSEKEVVRSASEIDSESMKKFAILYHFLLTNGVYLGPSGYEVGFISSAHRLETLTEAASIINRGFDLIFKS